MVRTCDAVAFPVSVRCVALTNLVVKAAPPHIPCAPLTKLDPPTVTEKLPTGRNAGLTFWGTGIGFCRLTELLPKTVLSAVLVAVTFSGFGAGRLKGALYFPVASMVPKVALPPATPFTDQLTA